MTDASCPNCERWKKRKELMKEALGIAAMLATIVGTFVAVGVLLL